MKIQKYYKLQARHFVDELFDRGYFSEKIARADMRAVENLLAFDYQSKVDSALRGERFLREIRKTQQNEKH